MIIPIGKHKGKSVEWLVLNKPDYVKWVLELPAPYGALAAIKSQALRLISLFDSKHIVKPCTNRNCSRAAIQFSGYKGNPWCYYAWCDTCDPYRAGAAPWKLTIIKTYTDALKFIQRHCDGRRSDYRLAIDTIARAKGFPERSSPPRIRKFFGEDVEPDAGEAVSQLVR
jgi:hypothetical protein